MNRILIIGCPGSGKSTFARNLAKVVDLPLIHLDSLYHTDDWPSDPAGKRELWRAKVRELVAEPRWIVDGNYKNTLEIRMEAADTIIFLDYPRLLTLYRLFKRQFVYRNKRRPDMPPTWKEKLSRDLIGFVWSYRRLERPRVSALLEKYRPGRSVYIARSPAETNRLLGAIREHGTPIKGDQNSGDRSAN